MSILTEFTLIWNIFLILLLSSQALHRSQLLTTSSTKPESNRESGTPKIEQQFKINTGVCYLRKFIDGRPSFVKWIIIENIHFFQGHGSVCGCDETSTGRSCSCDSNSRGCRHSSTSSERILRNLRVPFHRPIRSSLIQVLIYQSYTVVQWVEL